MILLLCIEQNSFTFLINTVMDFIQKLKIKQNNEFEGEVRCASRLLFLQMKSFLNFLFLKETVILYIQSMTVFFVTSPPPPARYSARHFPLVTPVSVTAGVRH